LASPKLIEVIRKAAVAAPGTFSVTQTVVTLPYPAQMDQRVTVVDAAVSASSKIVLCLAGVADTLANVGEEIDLLSLTAVPQSGQFQTQWHFLVPHAGPFTVNYVVG